MSSPSGRQSSGDNLNTLRQDVLRRTLHDSPTSQQAALDVSSATEHRATSASHSSNSIMRISSIVNTDMGHGPPYLPTQHGAHQATVTASHLQLSPIRGDLSISGDESGYEDIAATDSSGSSSEEWVKYAQIESGVSSDGGSQRWRCVWEIPRANGQPPSICLYKSKRQLVRRHIETTHLRYRPFVCEICGKGFPQKTSLDTHMHGHTGLTPHECRYGCGMSFKDPARRHRHMVEEHGYVPRQINRTRTTRPVNEASSSSGFGR